MDFFTNICNCFSTQLRQHIIGYLSSSNLNRQVLEQQKCTEQIQDKQDQSIYIHAKARSYYNIRAEDNEIHDHSQINNQLQIQIEQQINHEKSNWYPKEHMRYDEIFEKKLNILKIILSKQIDEQYQKVYDSQDEFQLLIYVKNQFQKGIFLYKIKVKKNNIYRFQFIVPNLDNQSKPEDYFTLQTINNEGKSFIESLLKNRQILKTTQNNLQICYRTYEKKLVISQHDFITAQKSVLEEELDEQSSSQNKQVFNKVVYNLCFSVKEVQDDKSVLFQRGNINLCGMKASLKTKIFNKQMQNEQENAENSNQFTKKQLKMQGFINVQLDTNVNSNMLKQPVAKQIRIYVQKLISLLQNSDAI